MAVERAAVLLGSLATRMGRHARQQQQQVHAQLARLSCGKFLRDAQLCEKLACFVLPEARERLLSYICLPPIQTRGRSLAAEKRTSARAER